MVNRGATLCKVVMLSRGIKLIYKKVNTRADI